MNMLSSTSNNLAIFFHDVLETVALAVPELQVHFPLLPEHPALTGANGRHCPGKLQLSSALRY